MDKPSCYNRPPAANTRWVQDGWIDSTIDGWLTKIPRMILLVDEMSKTCQQWGELGEARLRGWDCAGCKWKEKTL